MREFQGEKRGATMTSALEDTFAFQLDAAGLTGYVREYAAIPGRKFRFDFCFKRERLLIEINGGTYNGGAHGRGVGINRDYEKNNLAQIGGWRVLSFDTKMVKSGKALNVTEQILTNQSNTGAMK
jgi:very-short-patch-repair endonuclease